MASYLTPSLEKYISYQKTILVIGILIALSLLVSPWLGMILGGILLIFRSSLQAMYINLSSVFINHHTESKYRATTLSTFSLLRNIPYLIAAYFLGSFADTYSAIVLSSILGIILL